MFQGVLALVGRSLRIDARSLQPHLARFGLMVAIFCALLIAVVNAKLFGAPGLRFFYGIAWMNVLFMTLVGISFFSMAISEEKEEDTLGLMLMAGISPLGILIGKSGGRLVQALLLVAIQYPFTLLAVTMGGVTQTQITATYAALMAYMVLLSGFGLLCSTISPNNRSAAARMIVGLSIYIVIPIVARSYLSYVLGLAMRPQLRSMSLLNFVANCSVFNQMDVVLTTGSGEDWLTVQVVSDVVAGLACFGLSWLLFGYYARQPAAEAVTRGLVARTGRSRIFSPGRAWTNPFLWKDFHFVGGGVGMILARLAFCLGLYMVIAMTEPFMGGEGISAYQIFLSMAVVVDAGRVLARSLYDETRGQTLSSLMILPRNRLFVVYSKFAGAMLAWLPGLIVEGLVVLMFDQARRNFDSLMHDPEGAFVMSMFVLAPNIAAVLAVYLRWGAVPFGIAASIGLHFVLILSLEGTGNQRETIRSVAIMIIVIFNPICHVALIHRLRRLAVGS